MLQLAKTVSFVSAEGATNWRRLQKHVVNEEQVTIVKSTIRLTIDKFKLLVAILLNLRMDLDPSITNWGWMIINGCVTRDSTMNRSALAMGGIRANSYRELRDWNLSLIV
uniref:Uncharacterized protein n=1 Tax=Oryza brachyantha TaxID=4533 RepID=J3N6J4_ORYBR